MQSLAEVNNFNGSVRTGIHSYLPRLFFIMLFLGGYALTYSYFEKFELEYLFLSILSFCASWLLINGLPFSTAVNPYIWTLILIFSAYYIQFYWIALDPDMIVDKKFWLNALNWLAYSKEALIKAYATITYAFATFCLTAVFLAGNLKIPQEEKQHKEKFNYRLTSSVLFWTTFLLMGITSYAMYITGISQMGAESVYLPYRLAGLIFYTRFLLIPGLLIMLLWCSDVGGSRRQFNFGLLLLILHGLSDMLFRSSRGALLGTFIGVFMLFLITRRMSRQRLQLFVIILLATSVTFPVISSYRSIRAEDPRSTIMTSLKEAADISSDESSDIEETAYGRIASMFFRGGMLSIIPIVGTGIEPIGSRAIQTSVTKFFTNDVLGYDPDHIHGSAPSLVGWFYIVGGNLFVIIGIIAYTTVTWIYWRAMIKMNLMCLPVAKTLFLFSLLNISIEGTLEGLGFKVMVLSGSIAACEFFMRLSAVRPVLYPLGAAQEHQMKTLPAGMDTVSSGPTAEENSNIVDRGEINIETNEDSAPDQ